MNPCSASLPYKLRMRQFMKYRPQHAIAGNASCRYVGRTPRKMIGTLHSTYGPVEGLAAISAVDLYGSAELPACRLKNFVDKPRMHRTASGGGVLSMSSLWAVTLYVSSRMVK